MLIGTIYTLLFAFHAQGQSLTLLVTANNINVPMVTPQHYRDGNSINMPAALGVIATEKWSLSARVTGPFTFGTHAIPENGFAVDVITPIGISVPEILFRTTDQYLVKAANATIALGLPNTPLFLDLIFRTTGGQAFLGKPSGNYSSTIVYTLTAD